MKRLDPLSAKITTPEVASALCAGWQMRGLKVVFTNGVFDIVHHGHVALLAQAADCGQKLIVAVNSDTSVRKLGKGDNRPVNAESDRALVIAAMQMVDLVIVFNDDTPYELIDSIAPDVIVKGGDYNADQRDPYAKDYLVGSDLQRQRGKETVVIPIVEGYSTTSIIERSRSGKG